MSYGHRLLIYKTDRRTKSGKRLVESVEYKDHSSTAMMDEIMYLTHRVYKAKDGYRLDFEPLTVMVKSLMTGVMVEINYRDLGTVNDPSMERYWTM